MALTLEKLLLLLPYDAKPDKITVLDLADKGIVGLPKQTAFLKSLRRLTLAKNQLTDVLPIASIITLTNLDLSRNTTLTSLAPLAALTQLVVLSVGGCGLRSLEGIEGSKGTLKSLVANDNQIILGMDPTAKGGASLAPLIEANRRALMAVANVIETVVLSRNPNLTGGYNLIEGDKPTSSSKEGDTEDISKEHIMEDPRNPLHIFGSFEALRKLSLSECGIKCLPRRWYLPLLTELRLANNNITTVGNGVVLKSIKNLDISNNELSHWNVLHRCKFLKQLSVRGNPLNGVQTPMPLVPAPAPAPTTTTKKDGAEEKKKAAAPETNATILASPLHGNPLEVLYLRAVLPQLDMLDGRAFVDPPVGAAPEAIQLGIRGFHKRDHLARKAAEAKESGEEEKKTKKVATKAKGKATKAPRDNGDDDEYEDDGAMDATLLARKRRRAEESGEVADSPKPKVLEPVEDKEYEVPAAIAAKAAAIAGSANLVKRERRYAIGEAPQKGAPSNQKDKSSHKIAPVALSSESDVLAALRQPAPSGW